METSAARRKANGKATRDQPAYFLAGHVAPAGGYREMQTGRVLQMEEEGILPATCDGHVAVYVRQPMTWAEMDDLNDNPKNDLNDDPNKERRSKEGVCQMQPIPVFCEPCAQAGVRALAEYVYQSEETSLAGPTMGDPDYWPPDVNGQRLLCQEHYADLPEDSQLNYILALDCRAPDCTELSGEMGTASL